MFRECYFEYAGQSSQPYNLMLCYVSNSNTDFDSGGGFDLKTDTLPRSHETLLYGKDYSAKPLEFDVEFMNLHGYIPLEQMIEIKNWLFGQNGWKTFKCLDDRQDYRLKCVFEPGEDIVDGTGYRGLRCKLRNVSPFWYGEERVIEHKGYFNAVGTLAKSYHHFVIEVPNNNCVTEEIFPEITIGFSRAGNSWGIYETGKNMMIETSDAPSVAESIKLDDDDEFVYPATSRLHLDTTYLEKNGNAVEYHSSINSDDNKYYVYIATDDGELQLGAGFDEQPSETQIIERLNANGYHSDSYDSSSQSGTAMYMNDTLVVNTKYASVRSELYPSAIINHSVTGYDPKPIFRLHYGTNVIRVHYAWAFSSLSIKYVPCYRMGAF